MHDKSKLFLAFLVFYFAGNAIVNAAQNPCEFSPSKFMAEFNKILYEFKDANAAEKYLLERKNCDRTDYDSAVYFSLHGDLERYKYKSTKEPRYAKESEKYYKQGLSYRTDHDVVIYWHMSLLYLEEREIDRAIQILNKALDLNPKDPVPYLSSALVLSVEAWHWDQAKELIGILKNMKSDYYYSIPMLLATVKTLCYYDKQKVANQLVLVVAKEREQLTELEMDMMKKAKTIAGTCYR